LPRQNTRPSRKPPRPNVSTRSVTAKPNTRCRCPSTARFPSKPSRMT